MEAEEVKSLARSLGARACGIASPDRFQGAPEGFRPTDLYPGCGSVIVFLKEMPQDIILSENPIPYTHAAYQIYSELDRLGMELCRGLEARGVRAIPVPTDTPYLHWEPERSHGMGVLSLRHAAVHAGLGFLGRNTLLIHEHFGNMVYIGAILAGAPFQADPMGLGPGCPEGCSICLEGCPAGALDGVSVDQSRCREQSFYKTPRGFDLYACNRCRRLCPLRLGA